MGQETLFTLAGGPIVSFHLLSSNVEAFSGLCLIVISLFAAFYAQRVARLFGGALGKTWNMLAWVAYFFAAYQILLSLEEFGFVEFGGIDEILEILIAVFLLIAFYKAYKTLKGQTDGE
jgi:hypothetical protein